MKKTLFIAAILSSFISLISCRQNVSGNSENNTDTEKIKTDGTTEIQQTVAPPNVPAPVGSRAAKKVIVKLETIEKTGDLADGTQYHFWTFNGTVPGSFIRAKVGDEIELHLKNNETIPFRIISIFMQ
ncbi:exported protein of unknown function [Chryseobacterium sp. JV274]|nr:exported protein of unknown function [Chryseobacterium sp. JV274]